MLRFLHRRCSSDYTGWNHMQRLVIGDIHGCYNELMALLDAAALSEDDEIIALGDIVDRGPDSEKVLAFFEIRKMADWDSLSSSQQGALYAQHVGQGVLAGLLHRARTGRLSEEYLKKMLQTPDHARRVAREIGV